MLTDHTQISEWLKKYNITKYIINNNNSVSVDGNVNLQDYQLDSIDVQFHIIDGNFDCGKNNLTSLNGCPKEVHGNFTCSKNKLINLIDGPEVAILYDCSNNHLTSLEGCPKFIQNDFMCYNNFLESLTIAPQYVTGHFFCNDNPIKSLKDFKCEFGGIFRHVLSISNPESADRSKVKFIEDFEEYYNLSQTFSHDYYGFTMTYKELKSILSYNALQQKVSLIDKISKNKTKI